MRPLTRFAVLLGLSLLSACRSLSEPVPDATENASSPANDYYGTLEPFVSESVYFVLTDRFVNGDVDNDQRQQGGAQRTFDRPTPGAPAGLSDNIGYLGGDFRGLLNNAGYIRDLGFTAVWLTPIVDNPDEAFTGGEPAVWGSAMRDGGKTGYHGYWGVNFYRLDEHLPSPGLGFAELTAGLRQYGLKTVLDVVANHGSPAFSMPQAQPGFGQLYDAAGVLRADHQNLPPEQLQPQHNPLHAFYHNKPDLVQLSNLDDTQPAVLEYLVGAYQQWLDQGADALRLDTIGHMPHAFWQSFNARLRAHRPGLFLFGERFAYAAEIIAEHTWPEHGAMSVLDFPLKAAMGEVFEQADSDYARIEQALYLQDGPYANPYELGIFYDNHDMPRMNATDAGFIDAHHLLFTARGFPVVYYGSEIGFMRGTAEHAGNRNYFGQSRIDNALSHPIAEHLRRIARIRAQSPALQRGLMLPVQFKGDHAIFYRVYQYNATWQMALVLLNKGEQSAVLRVAGEFAQPGRWRSAMDGREWDWPEAAELRVDVPSHGVEVLLLNAPATAPRLLARLDQAMQRRLRPSVPEKN
jgi:cyclomaltodextrin glucanotransferase